MNIQVIFTRENEPDFVSKAIMARDKADFSHVLILYRDHDRKLKVFHAVGAGVGVYCPKEFFQDHIKVHSFDVKLRVSRDYFYGYIRGSKGKDYAESQIAAIAVGQEADNDDEKMICSELVGLVLTEMCGVPIEGDQDTWCPSHCFKALSL